LSLVGLSFTGGMVGDDSDRFEERTLSAEALGAAQRGQ
jgi:hypothetical protein